MFQCVNGNGFLKCCQEFLTLITEVRGRRKEHLRLLEDKINLELKSFHFIILSIYLIILSFQWCLVTGQEASGHKTRHRLESLHLWRYWENPLDISLCSCWPCLSRGIGLDDLQWSLPPSILWSYEMLGFGGRKKALLLVNWTHLDVLF